MVDWSTALGKERSLAVVVIWTLSAPPVGLFRFSQGCVLSEGMLKIQQRLQRKRHHGFLSILPSITSNLLWALHSSRACYRLQKLPFATLTIVAFIRISPGCPQCRHMWATTTQWLKVPPYRAHFDTQLIPIVSQSNCVSHKALTDIWHKKHQETILFQYQAGPIEQWKMDMLNACVDSPCHLYVRNTCQLNFFL